MPKLAAAILKKIKAANEGAKELALLTSEVVSKPFDELKSLGWCTSMGPVELEGWANENGDLAARILKAKIVNSAAQNEIRELLAELNDDTLDKRIENKTIEKKLDILRAEKSRKKEDKALEERDKLLKDPTGQQNMIKSLGGDAKLAEVMKLFPEMKLDDDQSKLEALSDMVTFDKLGGVSEYKLVMSYFLGQPPTDPRSAVAYLEGWKEINDMGGLKVYAEMGGVSNDDLQPKHVSAMFAEMKRMANSGDADKVRNMDPAKIDADQIKIVKQKAAVFSENMKKILVPNDRAKYMPIVKEIVAAIKAKNWNLAQAKVEGSLNAVINAAKLEANREKEQEDKLKELLKVLDGIKDKGTDKDISGYQSELDALAKPVKEHKYMEAKKQLAKLDYELDDIAKGSESKKSKLEARAKAIKDQMSELDTDLGKQAIANLWQQAEAHKNEYDDEEFNKSAIKMEKFLPYLKNYSQLKSQANQINWTDDEQVDIDKAINTLDDQLDRLSDGSYQHYADLMRKMIDEKTV